MKTKNTKRDSKIDKSSKDSPTTKSKVKTSKHSEDQDEQIQSHRTTDIQKPNTNNT